ncbi:MAG: ATP-binding cassette domain-containing protein [Bosea sp.]|uniref:ABC transporter ATP-binding protein n=1 Tax=Bosea sp. (in: a-proteobacteria) TaxID=1871050 RepID=UPI001ACF94AC|nr:oligopeptide/dipeptide ABC transporter ATP-binding protein [Bosea sp. (in: a-proteobacteria)]MBN9453726.1 ATP-binding cassette domain-containing protein [Bosea sp. (in: a-proteobacteria)]
MSIGDCIARLDAGSKSFGSQRDLIGRLAERAGLLSPPPQVRAVDAVTLEVRRGEVLGLVGESGCGKSTLGRMISGITALSGGRLLWGGRDTAMLARRDWRAAKLRMQMIFQNPFASLDPRITVERIVGEAPRVHGLIAASGLDEASYVGRYLDYAGLPAHLRNRYPHELSGGQRQRVGIARALAVQPDLLVCDESVAALDVSIQAQIINLFMDLRHELGLTYLFISHDLGLVEHISDRVAIMYLGRIVEQGSVDQIFRAPQHPYTQALLSEIPRLDPARRRFTALTGELPSPLNPPAGCHFNPRCPRAFDRCATISPPLLRTDDEHEVACHLIEGRL